MFKRIGTLLVNLIGFVFTCLLIGVVATGAVFYHFSRELPDYSELAHYNPQTVTRLYAADGKLLAEYAVEKRVYVPLSAVPKRVTQAFISAEDKNFYTNTGIDFYGIGRALRSNLHSFLSNSHSLAGGSTITQQVVKNFLLTPEKSITRKIKEAILAFRITQIYSKDRILELYLNEIYLGRGSYGVAAASINYFNKSLDELTVEEAAFLAALPQAPARSDPAQHYDRAKERRDWVINRMMEDGYITADEARTAIATPITMRARDKTETASADFFAEAVRRELAARYGDNVLYKGGLCVRTTLDPTLQQYADEALRYALREYDHRHGYRGPVSHFEHMTDWQQQLAQLIAKHRFPLFDGEQLAVVNDAENNHATIAFSDGKKATLARDSVTWAAHRGLHVGDVIIAAPAANEEKLPAKKGREEKKTAEEKAQYVIHQIPEVNGALIVVDPHTGRVLAMAGGYAYGGTEFNRATQAHRQPGSAFKPFVYLSAMENGYTPSTIVVDEPVELSQGTGMPIWRPNNFSAEYLGPATLRAGLEKSRNAMTVKLGQMLGVDKIVEVAKRFGIYDNPPPQLSMVLGAQETTLVRLANAYAIIDNGGKKVTPWLIERIDDRNGKTIFRRDTRNCPGCKIEDLSKAVSPIPPLPLDDREQIVDARVDYQIVSMLQGVVERGTGARARILGRPVAGKTGTTNDSRDTWFMGFTPNLVAGIYVGYDQPQSLGKKETGASVALPGFIDFMQHALKDKPSTPFRIPPGIEFIKVDAKTGQPPVLGDTNPIILEAFKEGEGPQTGQINSPAGTPLQGSFPLQGTAPQYNFPAENPPTPGAGLQEPAAQWQPTADTNPQHYLEENPHTEPPHHTDEGVGGLY